MQGSLDNPPVIIAMSRWKVGLLLIGSLLLAAGGAWMIAREPGKASGYFCLLFFGLCVLVFIWRFLSPPRLEISRDGLAWFNGRKTLTYAWNDFAGFRTYKPSSRNLSKYVGYQYREDHPKRGKMAAVARAIAGVDGGFSGQWELSADKVAALLNAAKDKWASPVP
jgi:hypothetical protein